ncbi:MAG: excisionase, partial [Treponema sp.]|nr:excisionase [Treponema sp.]
MREAIEMLGVLSEKELLARCYGLSLADQYWICPKDSGLTWDKINFFDNSFSRDVGDVLFGVRNKPAGDDIDMVSPDNTSDGWLKKRWVIHKGKRKLIKAGSPPYRQEPY